AVATAALCLSASTGLAHNGEWSSGGAPPCNVPCPPGAPPEQCPCPPDQQQQSCPASNEGEDPATNPYPGGSEPPANPIPPNSESSPPKVAYPDYDYTGPRLDTLM